MGALLDATLLRVFPGGGDRIRFIQIGGNDGVHEDPLYHHHTSGTLDFEWGQVFEPIPEYFEMLTRNMSPFPYITCHQFAVDDSAEPGKRQFNYVSPFDIEKHTLPPSSKGIGSFSRDRNALGGVGYGEAKFRAIRDYIRTIEVDTVPVSHVTNGVHSPTWDSADADALWTEACGKRRWRGTMESMGSDLRRVGRLAVHQSDLMMR